MWLAFALLVVPQVFGLDVLWRDGFEGFNLDRRWEITSGVWELGNPTSGPKAAFTGTNVAGTRLDGNYPEGAHTMLIRRQSFRVPDVNPRLRFRHWWHFNYDDYGQVQVREVGGAWEPLATYPQALWSVGRWERPSLDLSKYAGKEVQIGFLFHSQVHKDGRSFVADGWYLDELEVVSGPMVFRNPQSFEEPDFWDHWYSDNGVWEVGVPTYGPTNVAHGVNVAATILDGDYWDALYGQDSRLISPWLTLPAAGSPTLQFQHWHSFNYNDYGTVEVRTVGGSWEELARFTWSSNGKWYASSQSLEKYAGKEIQVGFRFHVQRYSDGRVFVGPGWYLDQLEIRTGLLNVDPPEILWDGLTVKELTSATFRVLGAPPGWKYDLAPDSPQGAQVDPVLGLFTWTPAECQGPGLYFITLTLIDTLGQTVDLLEVPVIVEEVILPPEIGSIPPILIVADVPVNLNVTHYAYDPDCPAQTLTYALDAGSPLNANVHPQTGVLDWTPSPEQAAQTNTLFLRVTDDTSLSATRTVLAGPFGPRISSVRLRDVDLELSLENVATGQQLVLESTIALSTPPGPTEWTDATTFTWQANPVLLEGVAGGGQPMRFYRLRLVP